MNKIGFYYFIIGILIINLFIIRLALAFENNIIFKVNNKPYTTLDIDIRSKYLKFIEENINISSKEILDDYVSTILFYEYYIENKIISSELKNKILEIYKNIINEHKNNDKKYFTVLEEEAILKNIELDFIRKIIIEEIINTKRDSILYQENNLDLLYDYNINYLNINLNEIDKNINLEYLNFDNISEVEDYLKINNIIFFKKNRKIENLNKLNKKIIEKIKNGEKFFKIIDDDIITFVSFDKKFETYNGLTAQIFSFETEITMDNMNLSCEYLNSNKDNLNILVKNYQFEKLNTKIKDNLKEIDDFIILSNNNKLTYIFLCGIKFDREMLNNLNLNKKISESAKSIERKFLKEHSVKYNLVINE